MKCEICGKDVQIKIHVLYLGEDVDTEGEKLSECAATWEICLMVCEQCSDKVYALLKSHHPTLFED